MATNTKPIGVAYEDPYLDGAVISNSTITVYHYAYPHGRWRCGLGKQIGLGSKCRTGRIC